MSFTESDLTCTSCGSNEADPQLGLCFACFSAERSGGYTDDPGAHGPECGACALCMGCPEGEAEVVDQAARLRPAREV